MLYRKKDKIFLLGFMGCGKSTLGKKIARLLHYRFIDLDKYIETRTGQRIAALFESIGEEGFRNVERECILSLLEEKHVVISTGGGTPCYFNTMDSLLDAGCCVYIQMSEAGLFSRLRKAVQKRPLIAGKTDDALRAYIHEKLSEREPIYARSHIVISGISIEAASLASILKRKVESVPSVT